MGNVVRNRTAVRLAVLTPYWDFWEHTVGPALRVQRRADAESLAQRLADCGEAAGGAAIEPS